MGGSRTQHHLSHPLPNASQERPVRGGACANPMPLTVLFRKRKPPPIDRRAVLKLYPLRNPSVGYELRSDGSCLLKVPFRPKGIAQLFSRIFKVPEEHQIELDETGATVWLLCDGQHSVESIVQRLVNQYKLERREAEFSLFAFLNLLSQRGFIAYLKKRR
ncbi:MAG: hypothetical protein C4336_01110 [Armatimonadota bacterium]